MKERYKMYTALNEFLSAVSSIDQQIHATAVLNVDETRVTDTQYGKMPVGSMLSIQYPLMPPDFKVYFNVPDGNDTDQSYQVVWYILNSQLLITLRY